VLTSLNGRYTLTFHPFCNWSLAQIAPAIVIRRTNDPTLRYEMFKRLNTGGSSAEPQEVRNASLRIVGEVGEQFLDFLGRCSQQPHFRK